MSISGQHLPGNPYDTPESLAGVIPRDDSMDRAAIEAAAREHNKHIVPGPEKTIDVDGVPHDANFDEYTDTAALKRLGTYRHAWDDDDDYYGPTRWYDYLNIKRYLARFTSDGAQHASSRDARRLAHSPVNLVSRS